MCCCHRVQAATGLRRQASTAASAMKDLDSDDEDLPVARSRKKRVFQAFAARSPAGAANAGSTNDDDADDQNNSDSEGTVISDGGSASNHSIHSDEESFEIIGADRGAGASDNIDDLLGLVSM